MSWIGSRGVARPGARVNRQAAGGAPVLRPVSDVVALGGAAFDATGPEPWLAVEPGRDPAGRWVRLRYRLDLLSDPVRPLLRMEMDDGAARHAILPGPVTGAGLWVGRIPEGVRRLAISPVRDPGPFAFSLDELSVLPRWRVALGALRRRPLVALDAIRLRLLGKRVRARHFLAMVWGSTAFADYAAWRAARSAPPLRPPARPGPVPSFGIVVQGPAGEGAFGRTLGSLEGQGVPHRVWRVEGGDVAGALAEAAACDWVGILRVGDTLEPHALACLAAAAARDPGLAVIVFDEDRPDGRGGRVPVFRPGWSPRLDEGSRGIEGANVVRGEFAVPMTNSPGLSGEFAARIRVGHVRRVLLHRAAVPDPLPAVPRPARTGTPQVSVVVPNRDSPALIRTCLAGLLTGTDYPRLDVVIVDNGSTDPETLALYASLDGDPRVTVLRRPGPFNFSALTNAGAAASGGELLLLLNNDIDVISGTWLSAMVDEAVRPGVGAVGAQLLYPDGRIQHAGVVVGLGGEAGHPYRGRPAGTPDRMGRPPVPHEVSAVTGACLLVPRAAYEAVGGLDEVRFPVSFNDIDLCLKLRRHGLRNIQVSDAVLYHHESASRGRDVGAKQARADREARAFAEAWLPVMRDDPYFHPALSLLRFDISLG